MQARVPNQTDGQVNVDHRGEAALLQFRDRSLFLFVPVVANRETEDSGILNRVSAEYGAAVETQVTVRIRRKLFTHLLREGGILQLDLFHAEVVEPIHLDELHSEHVIHTQDAKALLRIAVARFWMG